MCEKELLATIERKRDELVQNGLDYGLNSAVVLKLSQELDRLLNYFGKLQKMKKKERKKNTQ